MGCFGWFLLEDRSERDVFGTIADILKIRAHTRVSENVVETASPRVPGGAPQRECDGRVLLAYQMVGRVRGTPPRSLERESESENGPGCVGRSEQNPELQWVPIRDLATNSNRVTTTFPAELSRGAIHSIPDRVVVVTAAPTPRDFFLLAPTAATSPRTSPLATRKIIPPRPDFGKLAAFAVAVAMCCCRARPAV